MILPNTSERKTNPILYKDEDPIPIMPREKPKGDLNIHNQLNQIK